MPQTCMESAAKGVHADCRLGSAMRLSAVRAGHQQPKQYACATRLWWHKEQYFNDVSVGQWSFCGSFQTPSRMAFRL